MNILEYNSFYLVGIKGVAMTSLAQLLLDAGKAVRGSDAPEEFVTQPLLTRLKIPLDLSFSAELPADCECVIYTAAHKADQNPQVLAAVAKGLPVLSQAEALSQFFNRKKGIAICGVGGKSTTSAMITWILETTGRMPSYSVGVGYIGGLPATGKWSEQSQYFVAEADEYVTDPAAAQAGRAITPRFSYLRPFITVCTNLAYDHPDAYSDFAHTKAVFGQFFSQIALDGVLILNGDQRAEVQTMPTSAGKRLFFGSTAESDLWFDPATVVHQAGQTATAVHYGTESYTLKLSVPGVYNISNATAALLVAVTIGLPFAESCAALATFASTGRRFEFKGEKAGVTYYDDYAHHPNELTQVITAAQAAFPGRRLVVAFQAHTFSRTKELFAEFVTALAQAPELLLLDIFASAREQDDNTVTTGQLLAALKSTAPNQAEQNLHTIENLATYCKTELHPGDICLTVGAGDIYTVHSMLSESAS